MSHKNINLQEAAALMKRCLDIGHSEQSATLRVLDVGFVMRATGVTFEQADIVCLDTTPGFTHDAGFATGWELCRKLVYHNNLKGSI